MKPKYYNRTNTCDRCGKSLKPGNPCRERNEKGEWTGRWLCINCWYHVDYKNRPGSYGNIIKSLRNRRTGNLDPNSNSAKGDIFEELTCRWRGVKNLNIENDNYGSPIDHSKDPELGILQTKGRIYNTKDRNWNFITYRDYDKQFNNMICYCVDKDEKYIERIYIFPKEQ